MVETEKAQALETKKAVVENKNLNKVVAGKLSTDEEWKRLERLREERKNTFLDENDNVNLPNPIEKKGFARRYFNEENTQKALKNDWRFVDRDEAGLETDVPGSIVTRKVGFKPNGDPQYAMLMEKPKEWFNQDRRKRVFDVTDEKLGVIRKTGGFPQGKESAISTSLNFEANESKKSKKD